MKKEDMEKKTAIERFKKLSAERQRILSLPPEEVTGKILDSPQPAALVHSFPEEDLYFLIHDIGAEDALELLSLASDKQLEFILDTETWEKDRLDLNSMTRWLDLFLKSDPRRFIDHFVQQKPELFEFYLYKNIQVLMREHDQDPSDFDKSFFTYDDVFYVRFVDYPFEPALDKKEKKQREEFLAQLLDRLAASDHQQYQRMLLAAMNVISTESEEEAFRLRNVRLAEKGFLPFDEAVGIYQSLKPQDFKDRDLKTLAADSKELLPVPSFPTGMLKEKNMFTDALSVIDEYEILQQIQAEFAGLCNRIIAADHKRIRERNELRDTVKKACGYISIGLERLTGASRKSAAKPTKESAALITKHPLPDIFRVGFGLALELKWRADRWRNESWFQRKGLPLSFWGENWLGVLGGLLIKKPLFYDNYKTGALYRDFASLEDIGATEKILNEIVAFDSIFSLMDLEVKPEDFPNQINHKTLLLTLWARNNLGLSEVLLPISLPEFKKFYNSLWNTTTPRKIKRSMKESFLNWVSEKTGLRIDEISRKLGDTFETVFNEIESEYGNVLPKDLDPKFVFCFLTNKP